VNHPVIHKQFPPRPDMRGLFRNDWNHREQTAQRERPQSQTTSHHRLLKITDGQKQRFHDETVINQSDRAGVGFQMECQVSDQNVVPQRLNTSGFPAENISCRQFFHTRKAQQVKLLSGVVHADFEFC
jgi:hypothetical protein